MKHTILVLMVSLISLPLLAKEEKELPNLPDQSEIKTHTVTDPVFGEMVLKLDTDGEPVYNPTAMTVTLLCKDQRSQKNSVTPKEEILINGERLCEFKGHSYDNKTKVLTVYYSSSEPAEGEAKCDSDWSRTFNFPELCEEWQPK